jgi:RNA polymerase sigma factor (sigma-70 family)
LRLPISDVKTWFVNEVLVHEPDLVRFLRRKLPSFDEVEDVRQQIYALIYNKSLTEIPDNARFYLFAIARNVLVDRIRIKNRSTSHLIADYDINSVLSEEPSPHTIAEGRELIDRLEASLAALPDRCQEVVRLRKIDGLSQREVARLLEISESTVEKHVATGIRRLAEAVYGARQTIGLDE